MKTLMLTIAAVGLCLGACNTMTRGTESEVTITASPRGARIWTSLGHRCPSSPCVVKVERKTDFIAYAEARGYRQGSIEVKAQLSDKAAPGVIGNAILPGGSVGLVVDVASGANLDHVPNPAHIDLTRGGRGRRG